MAVSRPFLLLADSYSDVYLHASSFRYALGDGVPSNGTKIMIGTGANPPFFAKAAQGALNFSKKLQAQAQYQNRTHYIPPYLPES